METQSNHIWVGAVTLFLLAGLAAFTVWLTGFGDSNRDQYDIFFKTSVNGIAKGSSVAYAGVPSGQVKEIALWKKDPKYVRVRIEVDDDVPILQGTTATIQGVGFTGVSQIQLEGALKNAPPITDNGPEGVPVIPTKPGALGELLNNAPLLLERINRLTERATLLFSDENLKYLGGVLKNTDSLTKSFAEQAPEIGKTLSELQMTLQKASAAAEQIQGTAATAQNLLNDDGKKVSAELQKTLGDAGVAMNELALTFKKIQPGLGQLSGRTIPETERLLLELQETSRTLKNLTEKIDNEGAGSLLGAPALPDYEPK